MIFWRYELAQQLQQHQQAASIDDNTVDQQSMHVSTQMQVEIESDELQQTAEAVAAHPEAMLDLEPQHVVGTEETGLGQQLADQPLEAEEGNYFRVLTFGIIRIVLQPFLLTVVHVGISSLTSVNHSLCYVCMCESLVCI